ncbi:MAG TPA: CoA-binding protein [Chitinophagales bacterium]|nr:CoA-binding protein [Chitinophagales bacterium]
MKTLVLGASTNNTRYSNKAINLLRAHKHEVLGVGRDLGTVGDVEIKPDFPNDTDIDTVTMYLNPAHQQQYYDKIIAAKPRRIIFNPGAENDELAALAHKNGIATEEACTLVLLNTGQY